jgi:uncharacterized protein
MHRMGKIILFLVLALVAYLVIKGAGRRRPPLDASARLPEHMVACTRCGVNLPTSEALEDGGLFYCSEEHRRLGAG